MARNNLRVAQRLSIHRVLDCAKRGPAALVEPGYAFAAIPQGVTREQYEQIRESLAQAFHIWSDTWIIAPLEGLEYDNP